MFGFSSISWAFMAGWLSFQTINAQFENFNPITEFPDAQNENLTILHAEAREQKYPQIGSGSNPQGFIAPQKAFDNFYYIGSTYVSCWAFETGDGLILFDTLNDGNEVERIIIGGLRDLGFSPSDIKGAVVTHEHRDHYGGAAYLYNTYGVPIHGSKETWDVFNNLADGPKEDRTLRDKEIFTHGETSFEIISTPGHTDGTLSFFIPVIDNGVKLIGALYGGGGIPGNAEGKAEQIQSFRRFSKLSECRGVTVQLANHPNQDRTTQNLDILYTRRCEGEQCSIPTPFIVGTDHFKRFLHVQKICVRISAARRNQFLQI